MKTLFNHLIITLAALFITTSSAMAAEPLHLKQVLESIRDHHPDLQLNRIDRRIAMTESLNVEGMLDPTVSANIIASEEKVPVSSDFQASETRLGQFSGNIAKPLSNGGTLSANFTYNRIGNAYNSPFAAQLSRFNPSFKNQINASYRHPIFKGAGRPDYQQSMLAAEAGVDAARQQSLVTMHILSLQAISAFYQLAADDININIAQQAVKRSKKLLNYQRSREQFGLIEKADRLQAEALLAARKTGLQKAKAQRYNDQSSLNRLMLRPSAFEITIHPITARDIHAPSIADATEKALQFRPELQWLNAQMHVADAQLIMALDNDQVQLDVIAEVGTRALADSFGKGVTRGFEANDKRYYAALSFELSDVLGRKRVNAAIRKAELNRQRLKAQRIQVVEQINDDISSASSAISAGLPTLAYAKKQVVAEQRKFNAEMKRYRQGRSDTATLVQFEGELLNASLNAELQALSLQLAEKQLYWAQGSLLQDLGLNTAQLHNGDDTQ
ncbi:TolC family protein [Mariprofundus sp. EBB-1]|uniref:TolC family protein n=1 Tax=Mariprofundus sp. EBB-1 TaxID=2650971 RepID=UPI000EF1E06D|nr:TolC family protein [Mariprofundus sp. EBB-1]RLL52296.1 TolC family protein [Mariprofundus sp. EBB-1]